MSFTRTKQEQRQTWGLFAVTAAPGEAVGSTKAPKSVGVVCNCDETLEQEEESKLDNSLRTRFETTRWSLGGPGTSPEQKQRQTPPGLKRDPKRDENQSHGSS